MQLSMKSSEQWIAVETLPNCCRKHNSAVTSGFELGLRGVASTAGTDHTANDPVVDPIGYLSKVAIADMGPLPCTCRAAHHPTNVRARM
jgi:hypothetical protein